MIIRTYPIIVVTVIYIALLVILFVNRPWQKQHKLFMLYLAAAIIWSSSDFLLRSPYLPEFNLLLFRIVIISSLLWVVQLFYFFRAFLNQPPGIGVWLGYACFVILFVLALLGFAPPDISVNDGIVVPVYTWWYVFWVVPMFGLGLTGIYIFIKKLMVTKSNSEARNRTTYFLGAVSILVVFGILGVTPPFNHSFPWTHFGGIISASVFTYAILQHELVSISVILRRFLAAALLTILGVGAFLLLAYLSLSALRMDISGMTLFISVIIAFLITILVIWLRPKLTSRLEQIFSREKYYHQQKLLNFIRNEIHGVSDLKDLSQKFLQPLVKLVDCHQALMLLPSSKTGDYIAEFCEPNEKKPNLRINVNSPVLTWLKNRHLTRENLDVSPEFRGIWNDERNALKNLEIELLFPFISRDNLIGILVLSKKTNGRYSFDEINMLESITGQVAMSLEKEYYQEELRKREQELVLINRLTMLISSSLNIQEVFDAFIAGLKKVVTLDFAAVALIDGEDVQYAAIVTDISLPWKTGDKIPLKGTGTEWVVRNKRSMAEYDLLNDSMFTAGKTYKNIGIRSITYLPLFAKGTGIGSLVIASTNPNAYSAEEINLLERLASQIATSIDNTQLYARAEQRARVDELTGLFNRRHFDEVLRQEVNSHSRYGSSFTLCLIDLDNFKSYNDVSGHLAGDIIIKQAGQSMKAALRDTDIAFRYGGDEFALIMSHVNSATALTAAERLRERTIRDMGPVTMSIGLASWPQDGLLPDELVSAADTALYHAKRTGGNRSCTVSQVLPATLKKGTSGPDKESLNTIYALAATIEARDSYTYGHSRKVRSYAVALAESIGLSPDRVVAVSHAALLHDIGKIGVMDIVLNKKETLTTQEMELIKTHAMLSRNIAAHLESLTPSLPAILHHHERWDGTGYPYGLKGEMIPLEARILSVADAFDAMTSLRPYRMPLTTEAAIAELEKCAGNQFDPELVKAFIPLALNLKAKEIITP